MSRKDSSNDAPQLLNAEEIAARRIAVEDTEIAPGKRSNWHCHFCSRRFGNETTFMKHHCEPRRRAQELASPIGQAAYGYYREWMRMRKFSQPGAAAFMESKYYRQFINFAQMVIDANISKPERYIELMVAGKVDPTLWRRNSAYAIYLDYFDKISDPLDHVQESINYLLDICEKENVTLDEVFKHLGSQRIISFIRQRRLSPWLLFCSDTFKDILRGLLPEELEAFEIVVNSGYWADRFQKEQAAISNIKTIAKELGL